FEADLSISPFDGLQLAAGYAYLTTKITEIPTIADIVASLPPATLFNSFTLPRKGDPLNFAMKHKANVSVQLRLPLPESVGRISLGGTYVYQSKYRAVSDGCRAIPGVCAAGIGVGNGIIPSTEIINLNVNWENVAQLPVDAAFFVTNVTNTRYFTHVNDQLTRNFVSAMLGEPRMFGVRLRYKFGN
ncbi:MAG TPA: TonB-dependent receptor, partial [Novosphingobium sp.]|nr:TonB-dependent receptor [Novosphingobium sp.]